MNARRMSGWLAVMILTVAAPNLLVSAQSGHVTFVRAVVGQRPTTPINPLMRPANPRANLLLFETLVSYTADLRPRGQLAERWDVSDDGRIYTFYLQRNVRWHDGRPFTADDVVFTAQAALDERNRSRMRPYYRVNGQSVRVEKVDDATVRFMLPTPAAEFLYNLAQWNVMLPRHLLEGKDLMDAEFNGRPVGTGPYRFVQLKELELIRLAANPFYHLGRPKIDIWVDRGFEDQLSALAAMVRGEVDLVPLDTLSALEIARRLSGVKIHAYQPGWVFGLNLNHQASFFGDLRVRQALAHAIDREHLARTIAGDAPVAWSLIGPSSSWMYNPAIPRYLKDVNRARQLLDEAGLKRGAGGVLYKDGVPFRFTLLIEADATDSYPGAYARSLQTAFRAIGVEMRIEQHERRDLQRRLFAEGDFDAYLWWNGYNFDPDPRAYWHSSAAINNYGHPELDRLIEAAAAAPRPEIRKRFLDAIAMKVAQDVAFIPLYYFTRYVAARDTMRFPPPSAADFSNSAVLYDVHVIQRVR